MLPHWLILILSQQLVAEAYTRCEKAGCAYFVSAICRTNSNQFEFVRQIAVSKFCLSDNDFHMSHEAISLVAFLYHFPVDPWVSAIAGRRFGIGETSYVDWT